MNNLRVKDIVVILLFLTGCFILSIWEVTDKPEVKHRKRRHSKSVHRIKEQNGKGETSSKIKMKQASPSSILVLKRKTEALKKANDTRVKNKVSFRNNTKSKSLIAYEQETERLRRQGLLTKKGKSTVNKRSEKDIERDSIEACIKKLKRAGYHISKEF